MIADCLKSHREEILARRIRVFAVDESHVREGDICGYGWGNREQRREIEVTNYRDSQTYDGALDCPVGEMFLKDSQTANSQTTIEFVEHLCAQSPGAKIILVWDGAS